MKKILSLVLVLVLTSTLLTGFAMAEELADTVNIALTQDVESFNPWLMAQDARQQVYYNTIYEPLARLTFEGAREMVLAKEVTQAEPGCYAIELYDYIYDSKGNHLTASDVIFSFNKCIELGQLAWGTRYLDHFEQTGDYSLLMYTKDESAVALDMLLKTVFIVTEASFNESANEFATDPVGTGPYALDSYVPGSSVVITARDNYWQSDEALVSIAAKVGSVKTVNYKIITENAQLALALEMGEVDVVTGSPGISNVDYALFLDAERNPNAGYNVYSYINALIYHLEFNCGELSPLQDAKLREAITCAIDMSAIAYNLYGNDAMVCTTNSSPYYGDYDKALDEETTFPYDEEKAKALLSEAGYAPGELTLKLITQNTQEFTKLATLVQAYLGAIGINVELGIYENALFTSSRSDTVGDQWDLCLNCVMGLNSTGRLGVLDKNAYATGKNGLYLDDEKLQELYMEANLAATYSPETVTAMLNYVQENYYLYPMYYRVSYAITNDRVTDIVLDRNAAFIPGASTIHK